MRFRHSRTAAAIFGGLLISGAVPAGGCGLILGIHTVTEESADGGGGGGMTGASSSATTGTMGSTGTGGSSGGTGGMGTGGMGTGGMGTGGIGSGGGSSSGGGGGAPQCTDCMEPLWSQSLTGMGDQIVNDVAVDAQGNTIFVGSFNSDSDFKGDCPMGLSGPCPIVTSGDRDVYIVKLGPDGSPLWVKSAGDVDLQEATAVAVDKMGNIIVAGRFLGTLDVGGGPKTNPGISTFDVFVAKFDPDGLPMWSKQFGDNADQRIGGIAVDSGNNVLLVGQFKGTIDFGAGALTSAGGYDVFIAKLDASGAHVWSKRSGDAVDQKGFGIATDSSGNVAITGQCIGAMILDTKNLSCGSVASDVFVAKLDSSGMCLWGQSFGNETDLSQGKAVAMDGAGNVFITGDYNAPIDFIDGATHALASFGLSDTFISKIDGVTGKAVWSKSFAAAGDQIPASIAADVSGNVFVTGSMSGTVQFAGDALASGGFSDIFVIGYSSAGTPLCGVNYGDNQDQAGSSLAVTPAGELILGANFQGAVDLQCTQVLFSADLNDALVAKLKP